MFVRYEWLQRATYRIKGRSEDLLGGGGGIFNGLSFLLTMKRLINYEHFTCKASHADFGVSRDQPVLGSLLQAAPFTVRSTPDFRNTNGMEQKTVT